MTTHKIPWRIYVALIGSLVGTGIYSFALPIAILASTGEIGLAGVMAVAMQIPNIALAYPLATLSDSLPRKPMIVIAGAVNILSILTLALMIEQHMLSWFTIAALGFVSGVFSELAAASEAGYIPQLLGRENLLSYNARREICEGISAIIAPPTAGFIVLVAGSTVGLIVPVLLFGAATISYATLPSVEMETKPEQRETAQHGFIHRMFDGIQYMFSGAPQRLILVYTFFLAAATASYSLIIIYRLYEELTFEASAVGMIMACSGIGGIVAALIIDRFLSFENTRGMLLVANVVSLLGIPLVTVSNNPVVLGALLFILDVGWASAFIFSNNLRDCITPNELLGRASSLDGAVFGLGTLYSMGAVALMLDHLGSFNAALVVSIPAVLCLIYTLVHYKQFKVFNIVEQ